MSWIEENPNSTHVERIQAMAGAMVGTAGDPSAALLEQYGLPEDWLLADEPLEICVAFDNIVCRCSACDWWCGSDELNEDGECDECRNQQDDH